MVANGVQKISVVIPVYNVEKYFDRCMQSVLNQTYTNLEIILVDDGSTDNSGIMCDKYAKKDSRIRVIHQENKGLSEARNAGLDVLTGEYVFFIDSDDWIKDDAIEILYDNLKKYNLDVSCGSIRESFEDGTEKRYGPSGDQIFSSEEALLDLILDKKLKVVAWNKLYKASLFDGIRYPKGLIHEDEFTTYKTFLKSNQIGFISDETYYYFRRKDSIIGQGRTVKTLAYVQAWYERMLACKKHGFESCYGIAKFKLIGRCYDFRFKFDVTNDVHEALGSMWKSFGLKMSNDDMKCIQFKDRIKVTIKWVLLNLVY